MCKHVSIALLLFIRFRKLYIYEKGKDIIEYEKNILNICHTIIMLPNKTDFYCLMLTFFLRHQQPSCQEFWIQKYNWCETE
jgi:hypothetical protein